MKLHFAALTLFYLAVAISMCAAQDVRIDIDAAQETHRISRLLTGACIEDVNHEIYGGLYSQMVFGESFQEPASVIPGFRTLGGDWRVEDGTLFGKAGDGPKLVSESPAFTDGDVSVEVYFQEEAPGNGGLIVRVNKARPGADAFEGYEVSLDPSRQLLVLGRHRNNWELLREVPCQLKLKEWIQLTARLKGNTLEILVNDQSVLRHTDRGLAIESGTVGLRQWQRDSRYRNLQVKVADQTTSLSFEPKAGAELTAVSGMWKPTRSGTAEGKWLLIRQDAFLGEQSQVLTFLTGNGAIGIENRGLNRWGMNFDGRKPYEGVLWARAEQTVDVWLCLENDDGTRLLDEQLVRIAPGDWRRVEFELTPTASETNGRFAIKLKRPGSVRLGYASLQPGPWGRFSELPVRRDVAEALIDQGITVMRYGGSMVNNAAYRWKNMIGPRDRRTPYRGHWYPYSTNGWGIIDFMNFCEAAGFEYIPTFHMGETPADLVDFIEYARGSANTEWGRMRVRDGHPEPYKLKYLQLGNEERVDLAYAEKFEAIAKAVWARDPEIILVVGDFVYGRPITDPDNFTGAASRITSLAGQKRILQLAAEADREVRFDVHVWTDGPRPDDSFHSMFSYRDALSKIADRARFKVVTFEFNANSHNQRRALANALAINAIERDGRIPIATSANCLQPDGQNDNGWDQGLLFLNQSKTWLQPPGYVTQMVSHNYMPRMIKCDVQQQEPALDCNAKLSEDGKTLVMQAVNPTAKPIESIIHVTGFSPRESPARVVELAAPLDAANVATDSKAVAPKSRDWQHEMKDGKSRYTFAPYSVTIIRWQ
jgi:hypothetical protein